MKKLCCISIGLILMMTALGGFAAGQKAAQPDKATERVEIIAYLLGEPDTEFGEVMAEVNEQLVERVNATLTVNTLGWGDYDTKYPLILASGEPVDLIYAANWNNFSVEARKGGYLPLDDLLQKAAPKIYASLPEAAFNECSIDGKLYMVPTLKSSSLAHGLVVRADLRKEYGIDAVDSWESLGRYLEGVKANEPGIIPFNAGINDTGMYASLLVNEFGWTWNCFAGGVFSELQDPKSVFAWYLTPEFEEFAGRSRQWADKGYWPKAVLSNKLTGKDAFIAGTGAFFITNITDMNDTYRQVVKDHPDWEPEWYLLESAPVTELTSFTQDGFCIGATSKHPERALQVLELLKHDEELYTLMYYGIKGKHWDENSQGQLVEVTPGVSYSGESISVWGFGNPEHTRYPANIMPGYEEKVKWLVDMGVSNPYASFSFDINSIQTDLANLSNVYAQYGNPIVWGLVEDLDAALAQLKDQMSKAGIGKVLSEAKEQSAGYFGG